MNYKKLISAFLLMTSFATFSAQQSNSTISNSKKDKSEQENKCKNTSTMHFLQFGIMTRNHEDFKNKYCVDVVYENCVATAFLSEKAKKNNRKVAEYLTEKYGESWKKDLGFVPFGL